jgi:low temperature requirement protein LtrA
MVEPDGRGKTMSAPDAILLGFTLYVAVGLVTALAFVSVGISQVLAHPLEATLGARILLLPGSIALWPYIVLRWCKARSRG